MESGHQHGTVRDETIGNELGIVELSEAKRRLLQQKLQGILSQRPPDAISPRAAGEKVPLSAEQRRIWLHALQQPDLPIYNEPVTIHRQGALDMGILEASVNEILRRHEAWRATFTADGEQVIHSSASIAIELVDLTKLPPAEREGEARTLGTNDTLKVIPLDVAPLFRARVLRLEEDEYRLQLTIHHLIFDGVSIARVFLPELSAIYAAFENGDPSPLPPIAVQYGDYALWREENVESDSVKRHLTYWVDHLSGELPLLRLPEKHALPVPESNRCAAEYFVISGDLLAALEHLADLNQATLYMVLFAVYKILLFRYSGQNDLIVGTVADGRMRPELENLMGCFLDTLPVRTRPEGDMSFSQYLSQLRDAVVGGLANADVPFDRIVQEIKPKRDPRHHPIFQTFFSMRPPSTDSPEGWGQSTMDVVPPACKFPLSLEVCEHQDRLEARFLYSTEFWDSSTIERMAGHWRILLESVCQNSQMPIGDLALLTPQETAALVEPGGWNDCACDFPNMTLHALVEEQVHRTPQAVAVICGDKRYTYQQLNSRADELMVRLRSAGVTRGSIVAIALPRSLDLLAGLLAILKAGAAYLPIDSESPRERLALQLADAGPAAILTDHSFLDRLPSGAGVIVQVDEIQGDASQPAKAIGPVSTQPSNATEDTAYIIYTSGTTGKPKAVELSHGSLVNLLTSMQVVPGFAASDILLAVTPITFDIAALEMFVPILSGGIVVIASREEAHDPYLLSQAISRSGCTVIQATPATWRLLLLSGWKPDGRHTNGKQPSRLRVLCGGEALAGELADRLLSTGVELWNMYGPTETTIWSLVHRVDEARDRTEDPVSIGRPIGNTTAHILDGRQQPLPVGVPGELFLGGTGLAKGYRGQPDKTAERFVMVESVGGARLYRTGDVAVRKADGTIQVLGRTDNQVKVRGVRIELEAIEAAILRHPDVASAATRAFPDATGEFRLCGYIVPKVGAAAPDVRGLRDFLSNSLPESMIPSDVVPMTAIPLTPHGKVDRKRLPAPSATEKVELREMPSSGDEQRLASIWGDVLGQKQIGLDDNFFDLGGHSLMVAMLQHRLAAEFGLRIPAVELFYRPTIRQQVELVKKDEESQRVLPPGVVALQTQGEKRPVFWVHYLNEKLSSALGDEQPFYVVSLTPEDITSLGRAPSLQSIAACHLKKIFATQETGPYIIGGQCVGGALAYEIASQLRAAGEEVSLVVLIDVPNPAHKASRMPGSKLDYVRYLWNRTLQVGPWKGYSYIREQVQNNVTRALKTKDWTEMRMAQYVIESATKSYRPEEYDGNVLLLLSAQHAPHRDLLPGWQAVVRRNLHVQYLNAHHRDLLAPAHISAFADAIARYVATNNAGCLAPACSLQQLA